MIPEILKRNWKSFVAAGVTQKCIYRQMADPIYNGTVVDNSIISETTIDVIFDEIAATLIDESTILMIDRIALFPALTLPLGPTVSDIIVDSSSREWIVKQVGTDPANAHYSLRVRPING